MLDRENTNFKSETYKKILSSYAKNSILIFRRVRKNAKNQY
jgi:hypothetical protein